jgi:hypothetical protein
VGFSSAAKNILREADHRIGRLAAFRRVLLEARTPVHLAVLGPLLDAFTADPRISPFVTGGDSPAVKETLQATHPTVRWVERGQAEWQRIDLLINADPWGTVTLRRCRHRVNFFHGVAGKYDLDCPSGLPAGFGTYSRVAFANSDRMQRYLAAGIVTSDQAALVGYPKLDALVNGTFDPTDVRRSLGLDPSRPTVVFGPTWSAASALHLAGEAIIGALIGAGFNVIAKLHDRSLQTSERFSDGIDWRERLSRFSSTGAFALAPGHDSSPYLAAADAMVTDHSSIGFEYLTLDRPLFVFEAPDLARVARINPEKMSLLRSAATLVRTAPELAAAVHAGLRNPEQLSEQRHRVAAEMFFEPGTATDRALDVCYDLLELTRTKPAESFESFESVESFEESDPNASIGSSRSNPYASVRL